MMAWPLPSMATYNPRSVHLRMFEAGNLRDVAPPTKGRQYPAERTAR
jgi:hypothetical protein